MDHWGSDDESEEEEELDCSSKELSLGDDGTEDEGACQN